MQIELTDFQQRVDSTGKLTFIEGGYEKDIPFQIKRVYYIYGIDSDSHRGFHAHKNLEQCLICIHGSCEILMDDGTERTTVLLDNPNTGLHIPPGIWHEMYAFSKDAVLLVLASDYYDESDYIRSYDKFMGYMNREKALS